MREREKGSFIDFFSFVGRTYGKAVNKKTIEALIDADCFSSFNYNHKTLLYNIDNALTYAELVSNVDSSLVEKPIIISVDEMNKEELSGRELITFGFYLSNHPTLEYKARYQNIKDIKDIKDNFDKIIEVIVYVSKLKVINTKKDEEMAFITGEDETSSIDLVMFPNIYKDNQNISFGDIIKAKVRVEKRLSKYQLSIITVEILSDL
jgi:DNA polymerase-3 subunit alpha